MQNWDKNFPLTFTVLTLSKFNQNSEVLYMALENIIIGYVHENRTEKRLLKTFMVSLQLKKET